MTEIINQNVEPAAEIGLACTCFASLPMTFFTAPSLANNRFAPLIKRSVGNSWMKIRECKIFEPKVFKCQNVL